MTTLSETSGLPPGSPLTTLLAIAGFLAGGAPEQRLADWLTRRHGKLVTIKVPSLGNVVVVFDPAHVRSIASCSPGVLVSGRINEALGFLYGPSSMLLLDGEPHHRLRRLLVPPFRNKQVLAGYERVIEEVAEDVLDNLPFGKGIALLPELRHGMLEIILRVVFGLSDEARLAPFRVAMTELLDLATSPVTTFRFALRQAGGLRRWRRLQSALSTSNALIHEEIRLRHEDPATLDKDDILALLLRSRTEDGELLGDVEVRDQLVTLLIAGHETTATTLAWAMERLLRTPSALAGLQESLQAGSDAYSDAVVSETLRLRPPIPLFSREVAGDFELDGYRLPKGTLLLAHIGHIQQRADLFPDPQVFRPERFLGKRPELGMYSPFGGGIHSCIGNHFAALEVRVFLRVLFGRGEFKVDSLSPEWQARKAILNLPWRGVHATLVRRGARNVADPAPG